MTKEVHGPSTALVEPTGPYASVDLRGLDFYDRRRRLLSALQTLEQGERVHVLCDRADDVLWLRYEVEARVAERYSWSLPDEDRGIARTTVERP